MDFARDNFALKLVAALLAFAATFLAVRVLDSSSEPPELGSAGPGARAGTLPTASTAERIEALLRVRGRSGRPLVELVHEHGHALQRVVVNLPRNPRALLLVCREQVIRERAMRPEEPALVHDQGRREGSHDDEQRQRGHYEKPPERAWGRGHNMPRAIRTFARMSIQALKT